MMMKKELTLVQEFHEKFNVPIAQQCTLITKDRASFRYKLMNEEVAEYQAGVEGKNLENIAKELADILYATYGTILEHGLQDKIEDFFYEVHRSNLSKEYNEYKVMKGSNFVPADIKSLLS